MNYPYITKETFLHKHAVNSILRMLSYAPVLRERALTMIIERVIQIDVRIITFFYMQVEIRLEDIDEELDEYNAGVRLENVS